MITHSPQPTFHDRVELLEKFIHSSEHVTVIGHFNPDGDSVGSSTAMYRFIKGMGIGCTVVLPATFPQNLSFLDPEHEILFHSISPEASAASISQADLIICIDLNSPKRTEGLENAIRAATCRKILIDHHPDPEEDFFDIIFSDTSMSSACELLFWILMEMNGIDGDISKMPINVAESLATGMITDTNNFCNSVIPSTFRMASLLMDRGINPDAINSKVFGSYSENRMRLMGEMLSSMVFDRETHSACMILTRKDQLRFGFVSGDSEGFVNLALKIHDVETSALFTEESDRIRVSLRSKGLVSVNRLSHLYFNGGGHERASGGRLEIPVERVKDYFFSSIREFINKEGITFAALTDNHQA